MKSTNTLNDNEIRTVLFQFSERMRYNLENTSQHLSRPQAIELLNTLESSFASDHLPESSSENRLARYTLDYLLSDKRFSSEISYLIYQLHAGYSFDTDYKDIRSSVIAIITAAIIALGTNFELSYSEKEGFMFSVGREALQEESILGVAKEFFKLFEANNDAQKIILENAPLLILGASRLGSKGTAEDE